MAPWWVQGVIFGLVFAVAMAVVTRYQERQWSASVVVGALLGGAVYGLGMGLFVRRRRPRMLRGLEGFASVERQLVFRAASRGPVPEDSRLREAAIMVLQRRRDDAIRTRPRFIAIFGGFLVLTVVVALMDTSPWWWVAIALWVGFILLTALTPRLIDRRLAVVRRG